MARDAETTQSPRGSQAPKGGKGAVMTARITSELREALELEAGRTGRTLAQVAELWMEQARTGHATLDGILGLPGVGEVFRRMVAFAADLKGHNLDPAIDTYAAEALVVGWQAIVGRAMPMPSPGPREVALAESHKLVMEAAGDVLAALRKVAETDPENAAVQRMLRPPPSTRNALSALAAGYDPAERASPAELLQVISTTAKDYEKNAQRLFEQIDWTIDNLPTELEAAQEVMRPLHRLHQAYVAELEKRTTHARAQADAMRRCWALLQTTLPDASLPRADSTD